MVGMSVGAMIAVDEESFTEKRVVIEGECVIGVFDGQVGSYN
jgi:hypothetical protein